jgi:uncharacterized protein (DUF1697 family)
MKTYIALLRGINVGGHKKIKMTDLKVVLEKLGYESVETYIQSGNVVFKSEETNVQKIEEQIENGITKTFGFEIPVLVKKRAEVENILKESPYKKTEDLEANRIYYVLLKRKLKPDLSANLNQDDYPTELFSISENCIYLNCINGAGKAKLTNNIIERKLEVSTTTRNHRTLLKLLEISK